MGSWHINLIQVRVIEEDSEVHPGTRAKKQVTHGEERHPGTRA
jgi:hypothetical protein